MASAIWIPDGATTRCSGCSATFGMFLRRHHCRVCGRIFCHTCTSQRIAVPDLVRSPDAGYVLGALRWVAGNPERRCCDRCWEATHARDKAKFITEALLIAGDNGYCDIVDWRVLACLNVQWRDAMRTVIDEWASCAQLRPYVRPKKHQLRLMRINAPRVCGHVAWNVLLYSAQIPIPTYARLDRDTWCVGCDTLGCASSCASFPPVVADAMLLLAGDTTAMQRILRANNVRPLRCVVNAISAYAAHHPEVLEGLILPLSRCDAKGAAELCHLLFFATYARNAELAGSALLRVDDHTKAEWTKTLLMIGTLREIACKHMRVLGASSTEWEGALLPHDPGTRVLSLMSDAITVKGSSTKPVIVPCLCVRTSNPEQQFVQCLLLKEEPVFSDAAVQECLRFLGVISKTLPEHVVYDVHPMDHETGIISMFPGCRSLYSLWSDRVSIQNHIMEHCPYDSVSSIRNRFAGSCAINTVIGMLVGAGDRHLDNLLLTRRGIIFGCDFSFVLDAEPNAAKQILGNQCRITPSMVEMLGGVHSFYYSHFRSLSRDIYNRCRKFHVPFFYILRSLVLDGATTEERLQNKMERAWLPGSESDEDATITIENRIDRQSRGASYLFDSITDIMHHFVRRS